MKREPFRLLRLFKNFVVFIRNFMFEMNLVDFAFYATYSLTGLLPMKLTTDALFMSSKLMSVFLLSDCALYLSKIGFVACCGVRLNGCSTGNEAIKEATIDGIEIQKRGLV